MMSFATSQASNSTVRQSLDLAPDGDLVFVVGSEQRRLRVHSQQVRNASPAFNTMFQPKFKEGQALLQEGSAEVELPEDNADALEIILQVIHGYSDQVPTTLEPSRLLEVARACEKYDMARPLAFAIKVWLDCKVIRSSKELWAITMAACLFRHQQVFAEATSALAFNFGGSYLDLAREFEAANVIEFSVLLEIAVMLEETRNRLRMDLITYILTKDWSVPSLSRKTKMWPGLIAEFSQQAARLETSSIFLVLKRMQEDLFESVNGNAERLVIACRWNTTFRAIAENFRKGQEITGKLCILCLLKEEHREHE
ncbi:hypothetical protein B0I35DRAFT_197159 [Stachybotrys elegans]|uniref:BTB domain-containing protein n=1 Tax=Stachybotrys elegans TaxID=80388 RepID=A0A8K0SFJ9_9HYPO|nr:hypothetical protein B0I35DRAFT_197159 [Stachybotrys elegans]